MAVLRVFARLRRIRRTHRITLAPHSEPTVRHTEDPSACSAGSASAEGGCRLQFVRPRAPGLSRPGRRRPRQPRARLAEGVRAGVRMRVCELVGSLSLAASRLTASGSGLDRNPFTICSAQNAASRQCQAPGSRTEFRGSELVRAERHAAQFTAISAPSSSTIAYDRSGHTVSAGAVLRSEEAHKRSEAQTLWFSGETSVCTGGSAVFWPWPVVHRPPTLDHVLCSAAAV